MKKVLMVIICILAIGLFMGTSYAQVQTDANCPAPTPENNYYYLIVHEGFATTVTYRAESKPVPDGVGYSFVPSAITPKGALGLGTLITEGVTITGGRINIFKISK